MGSNKMADSLIFMVYSDSSGKNITLSPRLVYDHVEPSLTNLSVTVLPGSGIANDVMTVNAMCTNCRSWKGGSIDPTNAAAQFIFAVGPDGSINSNSGSANLKRHAEYGTFTMDLTKAYGIRGVPVALTADTAGTTQDSLTNDHDFAPALHAVVMILVFVGLMPFGVVVLRIFNRPKWHGLNQTLSACGALIGAGLGIYISTMYNRVSSCFCEIGEGTDIIIVQKLQFSSSSLWPPYYCRNDWTVDPGLPSPSNLQTHKGTHEAGPVPHLDR